ncbi:enoyl-CoA hydratase/isomerase family protein, partial [Sneathiella sp.]|uniref:enoyl-CoA hydratase/isomerase family protein n=1 Tax=Sneathiella sp. TaxID=1964365 RepID=UPI002619643C
MSEDAEILFEVKGAIGLVTLNRPKALNALTHEMCLALNAQLQKWETDDSVRAVLIEGAGEKAFCAGGDIVKLYNEGKDGGDYPYHFYRDEYLLNTRIKHFPKPYIALIDGIVMGGGVGVSV